MCIVSQIEIKDIADKSTDAINFDEENIVSISLALEKNGKVLTILPVKSNLVSYVRDVILYGKI